MAKAIKVQNLSFSYGDYPVLNNLSFDVDAGAIIGLIGVNGAGKTTLLKLLQGELAGNGAITVLGQHQGDPQIYAGIGAMPQGDLRLPGVTVKELLNNLRAGYPKQANVDQLLADNGLATLSNRRINRLSGGQLRRVTFLSALVGKPQLLFLDEPTVGMDVDARDHLWRKLEQMRQTGVTIIITSHYLEELQDVADQLLILQAGQIRFQGSFAELQAQYVQTRIRFTGTMTAGQLKGVPGVQSVRRSGAYWEVISTDGDDTLSALVHHFGQLSGLTVAKESLSSIFSTMIQTEVVE